MTDNIKIKIKEIMSKKTQIEVTNIKNREVVIGGMKIKWMDEDEADLKIVHKINMSKKRIIFLNKTKNQCNIRKKLKKMSLIQ